VTGGASPDAEGDPAYARPECPPHAQVTLALVDMTGVSRQAAAEASRLQSLTVRFAVLTLVVVSGLGAVLSVMLNRIVQARAQAGAARSAQAISEVAFVPHLGAEDFAGRLSAGHRAALDGTLSAARGGHAAFVAIRLWSASGRAIWADDPAVVGTVHPPAEEFGEALAGSVASEVFDAQSADRPSGTHGRLLEVYVPLTYPGRSKPAGVFEMYLPYAPVAAAISENQRRVQGVLAGGLVALYLVLLPIVASASRRLRRQAADNRRLALHDGLTGLPNRLLLADRIGQALKHADRSGQPIALLLLDLDRFKEINDTLGHHVGDLLLEQGARRLADRLRGSDTLARLGGDEFALLLPATDATAARQVAGAVLNALSEPFCVGDLTLSVEASIGIALAPDHGQDPDTLLQRADVAMYAAKARHTAVELYAAQDDDHSPARLALLGELRRAIDTDQLVLHYQPKADLTTGRLAGLEVLLRWQHPERGLIPPNDFIPLAERTGLIRPLTHWVLDRALAQLATWRQGGATLQLAVNVSTRNLADPGFPDDVADLLSRHAVRPGELELEVTESAVVADPAHAEAVLRRLSAMGISLAMDDFGTGYSCLANLERLPLNAIKIDKSFVQAMAGHPDAAAIVQSVIDLGGNLGLTVVAEGVETEDAWQDLAGRGCDLAQGYLLSRPVPAEQAGELLRAWSRRPTRVGATQDFGV
jgi:diguanylate cyclase (GGDEF)-like protein